LSKKQPAKKTETVYGPPQPVEKGNLFGETTPEYPEHVLKPPERRSTRDSAKRNAQRKRTGAEHAAVASSDESTAEIPADVPESAHASTNPIPDLERPTRRRGSIPHVESIRFSQRPPPMTSNRRVARPRRLTGSSATWLEI